LGRDRLLPCQRLRPGRAGVNRLQILERAFQEWADGRQPGNRLGLRRYAALVHGAEHLVDPGRRQAYAQYRHRVAERISADPGAIPGGRGAAYQYRTAARALGGLWAGDRAGDADRDLAYTIQPERVFLARLRQWREE